LSLQETVDLQIGLKKLNKDNMVKTLANKYDAFLASDTHIKNPLLRAQ
jgi:hypothetical protein